MRLGLKPVWIHQGVKVTLWEFLEPKQPALYGFAEPLHPGSVASLQFGHLGRDLATLDPSQLCWTESVLNSQVTSWLPLLGSYLCRLATLDLSHRPQWVTAASTPHLSYACWHSSSSCSKPLLNSWYHSSGSLTGLGLSIFQNKRCWVSLGSVCFLTWWRTKPLKSLLSTRLTHDQPPDQWPNISHLMGE